MDLQKQLLLLFYFFSFSVLQKLENCIVLRILLELFLHSFFASSIRIGPAVTRDSLLARATVLPLLIAS